MKNKFLIGISILVLVVAVFFIAKPSIEESLDAVTISVSDISSKAVFYDYEGIEYFVVKASDGTIKTAFNACDVCYDILPALKYGVSIG